LVVPGERENLVLCAASNDGKKLETSNDVCRVKLGQFKKMVSIQIVNIKLAEGTYGIMSDRKKFKSCKSKGYKLYKARVRDALASNAVYDCRTVINYAEIGNEEKLRYCVKHYEDEMKLEINLLSNDNTNLYNKLSECLSQDKSFAEVLNTKYLMKVIKSNLKSSFIQTKEVDEIDNDDVAEITTLKNNAMKPKQNDHVSFTQVKEKVQKIDTPKLGKKDKKKKKKVKKIEGLMYSKKKNETSTDAVRKQLFRITTINGLQTNHQWRHRLNEGMNGEYSEIVANQGNKNADKFVGFLGFLRDSAYDGNQNIQEVELERFFK